MAHQLTPEQVDEAAAAIAAGEEPAKIENLASPAAGEPTLAYGAEGDSVTKLVNLLAVIGHNTNNVIKGEHPRVDESVLVDVRAAQTQLGVSEPPIAGYEGELVGPATWTALYEAAAGELERKQAEKEAAPAG